jgi:hypothetical protein
MSRIPVLDHESATEEPCPHQIDLAHALSLDRVGPLLIGCVFERRRENIASSARHGIEGTNFAEKRLQAAGVRNIRLTITGLAADRHNLVSLLLQRSLHSGPRELSELAIDPVTSANLF